MKKKVKYLTEQKSSQSSNVMCEISVVLLFEILPIERPVLRLILTNTAKSRSPNLLVMNAKIFADCGMPD